MDHQCEDGNVNADCDQSKSVNASREPGRLPSGIRDDVHTFNQEHINKYLGTRLVEGSSDEVDIQCKRLDRPSV